ncbi:MAG TPA: serine/threonine-protein kinase [Thermoanaerobaculia bacterium]|nr:serine/threonine-protein kinase [Thermoanaerobaculia bacterium]
MAGAVERIAHYRILKRIGRGGMGIVYQAVDERDERMVALKVIREAEGPGDESAAHLKEARVRFDREAAILKSLLHVNVVAFLEIGEEDGTPWLSMEYLDGTPLTSFAGRPWTETVPLLVQAAHGLEYLSSRGIVHRDLSPDNILVIERGGDRLVKLLDFGVAKLFEKATGLESLTATGFFLGKVAYGSPEQLGSLGHGAPLDWRSDVYSLGVIFYQVLSGRRPFEGKAPVEYIAAHLNAVPPPVAAPSDGPSLPVPLVRLVGQMLEKRRESRPASWREIVDRLVAVLREAGGVRLPPGLDQPPGDTAPPELTSGTELVGVSQRDGSGTLPVGKRSLHEARLLMWFAAAGIVLVLAASWWAGRVRSSASVERSTPAAVLSQAPAALRTAPTPPPATPALAGPAAGRLQLVALPYARVVSIVDARTGNTVTLPPNPTTPLLVTDLSPGPYRVVLTGPGPGGRTVERVVSVAGGATVLLSEPFETPGALADLLTRGEAQ